MAKARMDDLTRWVENLSVCLSRHDSNKRATYNSKDQSWDGSWKLEMLRATKARLTANRETKMGQQRRYIPKGNRPRHRTIAVAFVRAWTQKSPPISTRTVRKLHLVDTGL